jgi:hypothetical protein
MINQPTENQSIQPIEDDEIDLLALAKSIWKGRKTLLISVFIGAVLGVAFALFSPKEYTATSVMVPQVGDSQSQLGGLGGLAALAGINLDMSKSSEMSPLLYPQIVSSVPFQLELMNTPVHFSGYPEPISLFDYYMNDKKFSLSGTIMKYTIGIPGMIIGAIKGKPKELELPEGLVDHPISLTNDQAKILKILVEQITLEANAKEGYLTLTVSLPEALVAAEIAQKAQKILQQYIIEFKVQKAKANLEFIQNRYEEMRKELLQDQINMATAKDRNKNFTSGVPLIEVERLTARFTITFSVFQELAKQLEQAKIQVKKDTPVFSIIKPVNIPTQKSKPNRPMILLIWIFLGGIAGIGLIFGKQYMKTLREKWNEEEPMPEVKVELPTIDEK